MSASHPPPHRIHDPITEGPQGGEEGAACGIAIGDATNTPPTNLTVELDDNDDDNDNDESYREAQEVEKSHESETMMSDDDDDNEEDAQRDDDTSTMNHNNPTNQGTMPLFHYHRPLGSLPRVIPSPPSSSAEEQYSSSLTSQPFRYECTASALGRVWLNADSTLPDDSDGATTSAPASSSSLTANSAPSSSSLEAPLPSLTRTYYNTSVEVVGYGFQTGKILVADVHANHSLGLLPPIRSDHVQHPIVAISWDATGTQLGVLDQGGMVAIYADLKYSIVLQTATAIEGEPNRPSASSSTTSSNAPTQPISQPPPPPPSSGGNAFTNFFSAFTGGRSGPTVGTATTPPSTSTSSAAPLTDGPFNSSPSEVATSTASPATTAPPPTRIPILAFAQKVGGSASSLNNVTIHRISFPLSFGIPTCMVIDPAYSKRQHVVIGFTNGKLVHAKRGFFQRRQDVVLYQGSSGPIQTVVWRGSYLAWADDSGIRIMDVETQLRIAHIDRPSGARPSLYPTLTNLIPSLCWETSTTLLVAWGDCLLSLAVREHQPQQQSGRSTSASSTERATSGVGATDSTTTTSPAGHVGPREESQRGFPGGDDDGSAMAPNPTATSSLSSSNLHRRRTVECIMAWQLDCIACGVVPLDVNHVVVLGLVPPLSDENVESDLEADAASPSLSDPNDVELQVISKVNGQVVYADLLPMIRKTIVTPTIPPTTASVTSKLRQLSLSPRHPPVASSTNPAAEDDLDHRDAASSYRLLSSFAISRMDDASEALVLEAVCGNNNDDGGLGGEDNLMPVSLFSTLQDSRRTSFRDSHLRWNLHNVSFDDESDEKDRHDADDADSVDSDDYGLIFQASMSDQTQQSHDKLSQPPVMVICASHDVVNVRVRNVDDAISYALDEHKAGLALYRGLCHRKELRQYDLQDLINAWFRAVLRLPSSDGSTTHKGATEPENRSAAQHLSLRRMKLTAEAMPKLLGGDISMWSLWIGEMEKIPGALFIARYSLPVRDPVLPKTIYARVLENMLVQIEQMTKFKSDRTTVDRLSLEAEGHFLSTLLAWGPIQSLTEYIRLYQLQAARDSTFSGTVRALEEGLARRHEQSSAGYLQFSEVETAAAPRAPNERSVQSVPYESSLYDIDEVLDIVLKRLSETTLLIASSRRQSEPDMDDSSSRSNSRVALDAVAKLNMMRGSIDEGLRYYLLIGIHHPASKWEDIEDEAIRTCYSNDVASKSSPKGRGSAYALVLNLIETHNLHQCLLSERFLFDDDDVPPILALARLVGLDLLGDFLIAHCIAPQGNTTTAASTKSSAVLVKSKAAKTDERRGTLPIDLVAQQLEGSPKLLHWYLHLVFVRKPHVYVIFPHTAIPPPIISFLHRKHLDLYIKFAGPHRDSSVVFQGVEAYRVPNTATPLLSFLKVVLQLGGIQPMDVAKLLQVERKGHSGVSPIFALELANILEHFGDDSEDEARLILNLYLRGCSNLMLAVSYAQRAQTHSSKLWELLIDYCLSETTATTSMETIRTPKKPGFGGSKKHVDGSLFGSLLEAAALSGADLAHLVQTIPPGMAIEGLRPRLVAAVADYRLKVQMRQRSLEIATRERIGLLQEVEHRSRRGARFMGSATGLRSASTTKASATSSSRHDDIIESASSPVSPSSSSSSDYLPHTHWRPDRWQLSFSLPIR